MKSFFRRKIVWIPCAVGGALLLIFGALILFSGPLVIAILKSKVRGTMGAELTIRKYSIHLFRGTATLEGVTLEKPGAMTVRCDRIRIATNVWRHLKGGRDLDTCTIENLFIRRTDDGTGAEPADFKVRDLTILDADIEIVYPQRSQPPRTIGVKNLRLEHAHFDNRDRMNLLWTASALEADVIADKATCHAFVGMREGVRTWAFTDVDLATAAGYWDLSTSMLLNSGRADLEFRFIGTQVTGRAIFRDFHVNRSGILGASPKLVDALEKRHKLLDLEFSLDLNRESIAGSISDGLGKVWKRLWEALPESFVRMLGDPLKQILESIRKK